jgi:hypothetical protein
MFSDNVFPLKTRLNDGARTFHFCLFRSLIGIGVSEGKYGDRIRGVELKINGLGS